MFRWMAAALDSIGSFVNSNPNYFKFGIPAAGMLLGIIGGQLGGRTGVLIVCYILFPIVLVLFIGNVWHEIREAPRDDP